MKTLLVLVAAAVGTLFGLFVASLLRMSRLMCDQEHDDLFDRY